jgi:hypothetical protein
MCALHDTHQQVTLQTQIIFFERLLSFINECEIVTGIH